jgi:DNA (cytosine-5)-methyltransferase 1
MGYKLAGCDVLGCLDIDKVQLMLYKDNLKPKYAYCDDIRDFFKRDDMPEELFNLDIFDASAPCTLFCGGKTGELAKSTSQPMSSLTAKKNALCLFCGTPKSSENNFCEDTL